MTSLLSFIALEFFLGMQHATDPYHLIAVNTISNLPTQDRAGGADRHRLGDRTHVDPPRSGLRHHAAIILF